jgi:predicted DNA-binding protein (MmcQ/YjbR family)
MPQTVRGITAKLLAHALSFPGAWEDHPWGENVAKVGKKVFVFFGVPDPRGQEMIVCVKLPESGLAALDLGIAEPAGYGLGKSGWIAARFGANDAPEIALLERWIDESYRAVAPRKLVAELDGAALASPRPKGAARKATAADAPARRRVKSAGPRTAKAPAKSKAKCAPPARGNARRRPGAR